MGGKHWNYVAGKAAHPEFVANARVIAEIPSTQLAHGPERDYLIAEALAGHVEAYRPLGSESFNLWWEEPVQKRIPLADWLLFRRLGHTD